MSDPDLNPEQILIILRARWKDVGIWHTGGGVMNPVIAIKETPEGEPLRYVMFLNSWGPSEASFSLYDETNGYPGEEIVGWCGAGDEVPMEPGDILALVLKTIPDLQEIAMTREPCPSCPAPLDLHDDGCCDYAAIAWSAEKAVDEASDYIRAFMQGQDSEEEQDPCGECDECKEGIRCREILENSVENAIEALWTNARDDKPYEFFCKETSPVLHTMTVDQVGEALDAAGDRPRCFECHKEMSADKVGDEFEEERVCDPCAGVEA